MKGIYITATAFDLLRWSNDGFYLSIEVKYQEQGININIQEVDIVPLEIEGDLVKYLVTATDYTYRNPESQMVQAEYGE